MKIGIAGGGILGMASGYYLSKAGHEVAVFEKNPALGGLSESFVLDNGSRLEKYHHFVSSSDSFLHGLLSELGLENELGWNCTRLGAYRNKRLYNFSGILDMLMYGDISIGDRLRFLGSMALLQLKSDGKGLDTVSAVDWIVRNSGERVYESIWKNLFEKSLMYTHPRSLPPGSGRGQAEGRRTGQFSAVSRNSDILRTAWMSFLPPCGKG